MSLYFIFLIVFLIGPLVLKSLSITSTTTLPSIILTLDYINSTGQLPQGDTNVEVNITNNGSPVDVEAEPKVSIIDGKVVVL